MMELKLLEKTDKIWQFLNNGVQLKNIITFSSKKISLKSLPVYLVIIYNLKYLNDGQPKVKLMLRILEKICAGSEIESGPKSTEK